LGYRIYDVAVLPGVVRPKVLGFSSSVVGDQITYVDNGLVQFWSAVPATRK